MISKSQQKISNLKLIEKHGYRRIEDTGEAAQNIWNTYSWVIRRRILKYWGEKIKLFLNLWKDIKSVSSSSVNMKLDKYRENHRQMKTKNHTKFSKEQIQIENM